MKSNESSYKPLIDKMIEGSDISNEDALKAFNDHDMQRVFEHIDPDEVFEFFEGIQDIDDAEEKLSEIIGLPEFSYDGAKALKYLLKTQEQKHLFDALSLEIRTLVAITELSEDELGNSYSPARVNKDLLKFKRMLESMHPVSRHILNVNASILLTGCSDAIVELGESHPDYKCFKVERLNAEFAFSDFANILSRAKEKTVGKGRPSTKSNPMEPLVISYAKYAFEKHTGKKASSSPEGYFDQFLRILFTESNPLYAREEQQRVIRKSPPPSPHVFDMAIPAGG